MITMIACVDQNMGIGKGNKLLAHLPKDLAHFKNTTEGHLVVFGKNTWDSLPVKPLANRQNAVMTSNFRFHVPKVWRLEMDDVLYYGRVRMHMSLDKQAKVFICGGESIYRQMMPHADELIISHMHAEFDTDTFFPNINLDEWLPYEIKQVQDTINFTIIKYRKRTE